MSQHADAPPENQQSSTARQEADAATGDRRADLVRWGSIGIATAAATAFGILATRAVADALTEKRGDRARRNKDRVGPARAATADPAGGSTDPDEAALRRQYEQEHAQRRRDRHRSGLLGDMGENAARITTGITALVALVNAAADGLEQISGRADGIMRDFGDTAERLRSFLGRDVNDMPEAGPQPRGERDAPATENTGADRTAHRL